MDVHLAVRGAAASAVAAALFHYRILETKPGLLNILLLS
ncbi:hypothetical protein HMPREF9412_3495 [Paenibacillus sp. HGF5]|nr:hypothetical protein HMPREF9412_3495 [Paenibacillus sp. HGF5]